MDPLRNPYQPGAGRRPPAIVGRDAQLQSFARAIGRCELGFGERGQILSGLRGFGKTVLLNEFESIAAQRGWVVVKMEAVRGTSAVRLLAGSLHRSLRIAAGTGGHERIMGLLRVFRSFSMTVDPGGSYSFGVAVDPATGRADSGDPQADLVDLVGELGATMLRLGTGAVLLIDEMQQVRPADLAAINAAMHAAGQGDQPLPVLLAGAGLPPLPEVLAAASSYAERLYEFTTLGPLQRDETFAALAEPAAALGVRWSPGALAAAEAFARGYPYFVQTAGKHVWESAAGDSITETEAAAGLRAARREVDAGLYRARWRRASPQQRAAMTAMAGLSEEGGPVRVADVAAAMGKSAKALASVREQLLKRGYVYSPERGALAFTVPGMAGFVLRQQE